MSETFDQEEQEAQGPPPRGRGRALVVTAVVLVIAFFALSAFANLWTERLWFASVDYGQVFSTLLLTKTVLFLVFGAIFALVVCANVVVAYRMRPIFALGALERSSLDRYREAVTPARTWLVAAVGAVLLLFAGTSGAAQWGTYLMWRHGQSFGQKDAIFGKDIGFYVFDLGWYHFVVDYAMAMLVVAAMAAALTHYLYGGIRLQAPPSERWSGPAQAQLSLLVGLFVLVKGVDFYLDRFDLTTHQGSRFTGVNYTADNAVLPAKNILIGISLICAILFFLNLWRRTWQLPTVGVSLLLLSAILLGVIWPAIVQQFQVAPSEPIKEAKYIGINIKATRAAYGLSGLTSTPYDATRADGTSSDLATQLISTPVVDPKLVQQAFEQNQQSRSYYTVAPVLDVDHYDIDGTDRALVLGAREIDTSRVPADSQNWSNMHTQYTHGQGLIAAFANQRNAADDPVSDSSIAFAEGIDAGQDALSQATGGFEQDIYFGEDSPDYSVVGKAKASDPDRELGLSSNGDSDSTTSDPKTTYEGTGGVPIGGIFNRLMYTLKYGETNFLLSKQVNTNSKILYIRKPLDRVKEVAPWLTLDSDPYPAVVDGRIQWIVDGYTTSDSYPNSQSESFATMTDDSLRDDSLGLPAVPTDELNYMRNTVKATVDAYDGTVTLYAWDENEPILKAWESVFPGLVKPRSAISPELMSHLRYPEDLFKVQRYQLAKYHVTDPGVFYQGNNQWEVPTDPNDPTHRQPPYRLFAPDNADSGAEKWSLTSVFVPVRKGNLASYISVDSDATSSDYGKLQLLELTDSGTDGPGLISNQFSTDQKVRRELLKFQQGNSPARYGNLLTLPADGGFIYVEPIYAVQAGASNGYPILQYVVVSYEGKVGIGKSIGDALISALGADRGGSSQGNQGGGNGGKGGQPSNLPVNDQIRALLQRADRVFADAQRALDQADLGTYQSLVSKAQKLVQRAVALANQRDASTGSSGSKGSNGSGGSQGSAPSSGPTAQPSSVPSSSPSASPLSSGG